MLDVQGRAERPPFLISWILLRSTRCCWSCTLAQYLNIEWKLCVTVAYGATYNCFSFWDCMLAAECVVAHFSFSPFTHVFEKHMNIAEFCKRMHCAWSEFLFAYLILIMNMYYIWPTCCFEWLCKPTIWVDTHVLIVIVEWFHDVNPSTLDVWLAELYISFVFDLTSKFVYLDRVAYKAVVSDI